MSKNFFNRSVRLNSFIYKLSLLFILIAALRSESSYSEEHWTPQQVVADFIDQKISRHIDKSLYRVNVKFKKQAKVQKNQLPYVPEKLKDWAEEEKPENLIKNSKDLKIEIAVEKNSLKKFRKIIETIVQDELMVDMKKSPITFSSFQLPTSLNEKKENAFNTELSASLREEKRENEKLKSENENLQQKINLIQRNLEKLEREPKTISMIQSPAENIQLAWQDKILQSKWLIPILLIFTMILVAVITGTFIFKSAAQIQSGLVKLGSQMATFRDNRQITDQKQIMNSEKSIKENNSNEKITLTLDHAQGRVNYLTETIVRLANDQKEISSQVLINFINLAIARHNRVDMATCALEIIPPLLRQQVYHKLNMKHKISLDSFLTRAEYPKNKVLVMLDVCETVHSMLLTSSLSFEKKLTDPQIHNIIIGADTEDMIELMREAEDEILGRLLCYLDAKNIATCINILQNIDLNLVERVSEGLASLHEFEQRKDLDQKLRNHLNIINEKNRNIRGTNTNQLLLDIMNQLNDDSSVVFLNSIGRISPESKHVIENKSIRFDTFFHIYDEIQENILERLNSLQIMSLLANLPTEQCQIIRSHMDANRLKILEDELKMFSKRKNKMQLFNDTKNYIKQEIRIEDIDPSRIENITYHEGNVA